MCIQIHTFDYIVVRTCVRACLRMFGGDARLSPFLSFSLSRALYPV